VHPKARGKLVFFFFSFIRKPWDDPLSSTRERRRRPTTTSSSSTALQDNQKPRPWACLGDWNQSEARPRPLIEPSMSHPSLIPLYVHGNRKWHQTRKNREPTGWLVEFSAYWKQWGLSLIEPFHPHTRTKAFMACLWWMYSTLYSPTYSTHCPQNNSTIQWLLWVHTFTHFSDKQLVRFIII